MPHTPNGAFIAQLVWKHVRITDVVETGNDSCDRSGAELHCCATIRGAGLLLAEEETRLLVFAALCTGTCIDWRQVRWHTGPRKPFDWAS